MHNEAMRMDFEIVLTNLNIYLNSANIGLAEQLKQFCVEMYKLFNLDMNNSLIEQINQNIDFFEYAPTNRQYLKKITNIKEVFYEIGLIVTDQVLIEGLPLMHSFFVNLNKFEPETIENFDYNKIQDEITRDRAFISKNKNSTSLPFIGEMMSSSKLTIPKAPSTQKNKCSKIFEDFSGSSNLNCFEYFKQEQNQQVITAINQLDEQQRWQIINFQQKYFAMRSTKINYLINEAEKYHWPKAELERKLATEIDIETSNIECIDLRNIVNIISNEFLLKPQLALEFILNFVNSPFSISDDRHLSYVDNRKQNAENELMETDQTKQE